MNQVNFLNTESDNKTCKL